MTESPPASTDAELLPRLRAGDESAFNEVYAQHYAGLLQMLTHRLRNSADAEEIANDSFINFFRRIDQFRGDSSIKTWLWRIAINKAHNRYHHKVRRGLWLNDSIDKPLTEDGFTIGDTLANADGRGEIELEEVEENIRLAMDRISTRHREILDLLIVGHKTYEEIAAILGINLGTVKSRVARARDAVRQELQNMSMNPMPKTSPTNGRPPPSLQNGKAHDIGAWLQAQNVRFVSRITVFQIEVTPRLAEAWLRLNTKNRIPSNPKISRFANMMRDGRWVLNGETIKFAEGGRLLDGQSRLMALVKAGVNVILEVRGGIADAAQESMDTGEARQHRHQLEMLGEKYPNEIAAALRLIHLSQYGSFGSSGSRTSGARDITNTTIRETLEKHPGIRESVGRCLNLRSLIPISTAAFFHYMFARVDAKKAALFIERLTTGANLSETSPIYLLRERLTQDRLSSTKIRKREKLALVVKAWNAFYGGKDIQRLSFHADETFPEIAGIENAPAQPALK